MNKHIICVKGASAQLGFVAKLLHHVEDGEPAVLTGLEGPGKTAEEAMGTLVLEHGDKVPELVVFRRSFLTPPIATPQFVGEQLMATARKHPGLIIGVNIDISANWPQFAV
jgi:hypothetical protein